MTFTQETQRGNVRGNKKADDLLQETPTNVKKLAEARLATEHEKIY